MVKTGSGQIKPLTTRQVAGMLKAQGLKATPDELEELTRMMNAHREREAREAARRKSDQANERFFDVLSAPVLKEMAEREAAAAKKAARKRRR